MGILDRSDEFVERLGQFARCLQLSGEFLKLRPGRQRTLEEQVHGFLEGRALGKIVDGITAIAQLALASVDIAHLRTVEVHAFQATIDLDLFC